jgi:hypothetical protein
LPAAGTVLNGISSLQLDLLANAEIGAAVICRLARDGRTALEGAIDSLHRLAANAKALGVEHIDGLLLGLWAGVVVVAVDLVGLGSKA